MLSFFPPRLADFNYVTRRKRRFLLTFLILIDCNFSLKKMALLMISVECFVRNDHGFTERQVAPISGTMSPFTAFDTRHSRNSSAVRQHAVNHSR